MEASVTKKSATIRLAWVACLAQFAVLIGSVYVGLVRRPIPVPPAELVVMGLMTIYLELLLTRAILQICAGRFRSHFIRRSGLAGMLAIAGILWAASLGFVLAGEVLMGLFGLLLGANSTFVAILECRFAAANIAERG